MPQVEEPVNERIEARTLIKKSLDGNIGTITLNNPPKHNALGTALIGELLVALSDLTIAGAGAIVLRAYKGAKVLSAGHDIRELPTNGRDPFDVRRSVAKSGARLRNLRHRSSRW